MWTTVEDFSPLFTELTYLITHLLQVFCLFVNFLSQFFHLGFVQSLYEKNIKM